MSAIADNYRRIQEEVKELAQKYNRNPEEILLVAVSKGCSLEQIQEAMRAGCRNFGENRIQEAESKTTAGLSEIDWHFIGHLQKNKVGKTIGKFCLIHSVDGLELAQKLSQHSVEAGCVTKILLQVNTSGEAAKQGMSEQEAPKILETCLSLPGISVEGLMTIAPNVSDEKVLRNCFARLRILKETLIKYAPLRHLSMGMSNDYKYAIAEGATLLRIGSAIFK